MKQEPLVGCHVSIAGGVHTAFARAALVGCTTFQIFTKSNRVWFEKKLSDQAIEKFKQEAAASTIKSIVVHTGYLINLGSGKKETAELSANALLDEVRRCEQLGLHDLVLHPGSHVGIGEEKSIAQIAYYLDSVIERSAGLVTIVLELMAGQGTSVACSFEQLHKIRSLCHHKKLIAYCLDTCHACASGYDIVSADGYYAMMQRCEQILGLEHLKVIHLNDSKGVVGSHVDRHASLGTGVISLDVFAAIMNDRRLKNIPKILETPSDAAMKLWEREIALLKEMTGT
ncbi:MAG: deoxyribonuclease IV [Candidatus Babeliales bacterium]|jgi:deoxyribonuclease-4